MTPGRDNSSTITPRDSAPNEEWLLIYRGGLPGGRIAELAGVPVSTVSYHLRLARAADPELRPAHEGASRPRARVTRRGLERMQELITMAQEAGHYPSGMPRAAQSGAWPRGSSVDGRITAPARWLQRRREDYRAGTLAPAFREGLAVLPGWEGKPRIEADEERRQRRLAALIRYRAAGNDWPRHKAVITGEEHDLGIWQHSQRVRHRRGDLDAGKATALDAALPGWRPGRKRGQRTTISAQRGGIS